MNRKSFSLHLNTEDEGGGSFATFDLHDIERSSPDYRATMGTFFRVLKVEDRHGDEAVLFFSDEATWDRFCEMVAAAAPFPSESVSA